MGAAKPWTPRHVNEAKSALYRLAADAIAKADHAGADGLMRLATDDLITGDEGRFQLGLIVGSNLSAASVEREMRRVRARAEGREVVSVETRWRGRCGATVVDGREDYVRGLVSVTEGARVVRVTLTRRRIVRAEKA